MDFSERGQDSGKRLAGITVVIVVHALLIYALLNGLGEQIITVIKTLPIETKLIEEVKPALPMPSTLPTPSKKVTPPKLFIPAPEVAVHSAPNAIQAVTNEPPAQSEMLASNATAPVAAKGLSVIQAVVDFSTCAKPDYPRNALRNEEQGTVRIQFLIDLDGRVADSKIDKSSGFRMLDAAAKKALSLCKFKPGTIDGKPQQSWTAVDYVWKLPE
jgi:protein TonB